MAKASPVASAMSKSFVYSFCPLLCAYQWHVTSVSTGIYWSNSWSVLPSILKLQTLIQIVANSIFHECTKHFEEDFHSICEAFDAYIISLMCISTDLQIAVLLKLFPKTDITLWLTIWCVDHTTSIWGGC